MMKELIAFDARLRRSHGSDFPTVINIVVPAIQEHIKIRPHLFMEFENTSVNASAVKCTC